MKRPYVQAKGTNLAKELRNELLKQMPLFKQYQGIAGIMLDGGISRGFADALSEIDVVLFLHQEAYNLYQTSLTPTALGITKIDGYLYDIKLCCYEDELSRSYDQIALWDLSYAEIIFDPNAELKALFTTKLSHKNDYSAAGGYMFSAWWSYRLAGDIWIAREDIAQAHFMLNAAITPLLSALYIINNEYIPHEKWLLHMSRSLSWLPSNYEQSLDQLVIPKDSSLNGVRERQAAINELWNNIDCKLCELTNCPDGLNVMHQWSYNSLCELYKKGRISLSEWNNHHSIGDLNYDPLNKLAKIEGNNVVFCHDALAALTDHEMYSWFYQLAEALRNNSF